MGCQGCLLVNRKSTITSIYWKSPIPVASRRVSKKLLVEGKHVIHTHIIATTTVSIALVAQRCASRPRNRPFVFILCGKKEKIGHERRKKKWHM